MALLPKNVRGSTSDTTKIVIATALLVAAVVALSVLYYVRGGTSDIHTLTSTEARVAPPAGWKEYISASHRFSVWHPPELLMRTYDEGNNSHTIVFEDGEEQSFQIFITPYTEDHITKERFALDAPSGVFENPVEVVIGNVARGTVFFGKHALLGDTREVWFIHKGFLYEITTYRDLDEWLASIMSTWSFL